MLFSDCCDKPQKAEIIEADNTSREIFNHPIAPVVKAQKNTAARTTGYILETRRAGLIEIAVGFIRRRGH